MYITQPLIVIILLLEIAMLRRMSDNKISWNSTHPLIAYCLLYYFTL